PGTIRLYGTPAEEGGGGKIYMARAGLFEGVDVVLTWHPGDRNVAGTSTSLANINAKFRFRGQPAHAAGSPEKGRSALDALLLMAHGVELLREHIPSETRIHYIITKGGEAPNVVPDFAEIYIYARHSHMPTLDDVWSRIVKCAEAGALATGTRMEMELVNSVYNTLPNDALSALVDKNLRTRGGIQSSSTDVGDISWQLPTSSLTTATFVPGTPGHSWQSTACAGMTIGRKGMLVAAKTLALSALDLLTTPSEIA